MSNIIDSIRLSGTVYTIAGGSGGNPTVELTQAEYDDLVSAGTVSPTTYYIITDAQPTDISLYWTSAQTQSAINLAVSGKQDTLSAGTNITIVDNVISATGGGSITIDPTLDSGSTNPVANSAITLSLENKANLSDVVLNNYGNSSTYSSAFVSKKAYRIVVNGLTGNLWNFRVIEGSTLGYYGVNNTGNFYDSNGVQIDAPYFINTDLTNYSNGTFDICFNTDNVYADYFANTLGKTFTIYESFSLKSLKTQVIENTTALSGKQDTLSAGTNITIVDNVISATGGGGGTTYTAGRGIDITNDTISFNLPISAYTNGSVIIGTSHNTVPYGEYGAFVWGGSPMYSSSGNIAKFCSQAGGWGCSALGDYTLAVGYSNSALTDFSVALNYENATSNKHETALGRYNNSVSASTTFGDSGNTLFSVGNGTNNARHNAFEIRQNGDIYITSGGTDILLQDNLGGLKLVKITAADYANITPDENTVYFVGDSNGYTMKLGSVNIS